MEGGGGVKVSSCKADGDITIILLLLLWQPCFLEMIDRQNTRTVLEYDTTDTHTKVIERSFIPRQTLTTVPYG